MPFKKGQSGNPLGAAIWKDKPIAVLARKHSKVALNTLARIAADTQAPHASQVSASIALLDRGYGRPASFSTSDSTQLKRAIDMTDDELAAIVSKARLSVVK